MNNHVKSIFKTALWTFIVILIIYFICFIVFMFGTHPYRAQAKTVNNLALTKTPITKINHTYHMSLSKVSNSVEGTDKKGAKYYFTYLEGSNKAYLYKASEGISRAQTQNAFNSRHPGHHNLMTTFGWYQNKPVWEISYKKSNGNYGYAIYSFKTGKQLFYVDNL
ncbi:hypothetical protein [Lactobacillus sp. PV034]|uniref:hypothetical protein n=1 Tax=Lactobacillus sp. PV034 TaxID=2594495 RepID=UPI0022400812|nr:hypothetical protein [Lactobacillus sp. PV034]QNQ80408.1 hypothetical protein FP432_01985 [Lactobacillus sp. PV034]